MLKNRTQAPPLENKIIPWTPLPPPPPFEKIFWIQACTSTIDLPEQVHIQLKLDEKSYRVTAPLIHLSMKISNYG